MKLGERWHTDPRLEQIFHRFHLVVEIALVAALIWFVLVASEPCKTAEYGVSKPALFVLNRAVNSDFEIISKGRLGEAMATKRKGGSKKAGSHGESLVRRP